MNSQISFLNSLRKKEIYNEVLSLQSEYNSLDSPSKTELDISKKISGPNVFSHMKEAQRLAGRAERLKKEFTVKRNKLQMDHCYQSKKR